MNDPDLNSLIEKNTTIAHTDTIMDLKTGIYNLFVTLFNQYVLEYGVENAIHISTDFLEEIVINFRHALVEDTEK